MCIQLLGGAFTAELVKGKDGKKKWTYTHVPKKIERVSKEKERPQFPVVEKYELASSKRYQEDLRSSVIDITKYLKGLIK